MKVRQIHKENQIEKDILKNLDVTKAWDNFIAYINKYDINKAIDKLAYPSDFEFFKTRAELFKINHYATNNSSEMKEVLEYFTLECIYKYIKKEIPKKVPNSKIKIKLIEDAWNSHITGYYKGEKK